MKPKTKVGLLGCGGIVGAHRQGFESAKSICEVTAVAEPRKERHEWIREAFGPDVRIVANYKDALAMDDVNAVDIVLPHYLHMPAAIDAARAGKHVLVEKVMARNVWECDRIIEACEKAGVILTVAHDRRYHPEWIAMKKIIDSGMLGNIFYWKLDHNQNVALNPESWAFSKDGLGGGAIMSCLTHQIDGLRWYAGEVASVCCMTKTDPKRMEGEFLGVILARMASGALAELSINWRTLSNRGDNCLWYEMTQACGDRGECYRMSNRGTFLRLHEATPAEIKEYGEGVTEGFVKIPTPEGAGHPDCIHEWLKAIRGEDAHIVTGGRDCRGSVEVAEAAYISVEQGMTVDLPIEPKPWKNSNPQEELDKLKAFNRKGISKSKINADNPLAAK